MGPLANYEVSLSVLEWTTDLALLADSTPTLIRNTRLISLTVEHLVVLILISVSIRTDLLIRSNIILTHLLVTSLADPIRLLLRPLHPHKEYLEHPPVQELKGQLETRLLAAAAADRRVSDTTPI